MKTIQKQLKNALEEILTHKRETGEGMEERAEMQEHQVKDKIGLTLSFPIPQTSSPSFNVIAKVTIIKTKSATIAFFFSSPPFLFFSFVAMILGLVGLEKSAF